MRSYYNAMMATLEPAVTGGEDLTDYPVRPQLPQGEESE